MNLYFRDARGKEIFGVGGGTFMLLSGLIDDLKKDKQINLVKLRSFIYVYIAYWSRV
jgi:hypothetical protein